MKLIFSIFILSLFSFCESKKETMYTGSTPAAAEVRNFLGISLTDSIDFIRWKISITNDHYSLDCRYGIGKPNTNGFYVEKKAAFPGTIKKQGNYFQLQNGSKSIWLLQINANLFHLADKDKNFLIGTGGFSYALNSMSPVKTNEFTPRAKITAIKNHIVYQGRTPCQELAKLMGELKGADCIRMKWYMILYVDSATGKPTYYLQGGRQYKKETMTRGNWEIVQGKDGKIVYKLEMKTKGFFIYLLKGDDNILFFSDADGAPLVGNENFSYTLNRTIDHEPTQF